MKCPDIRLVPALPKRWFAGALAAILALTSNNPRRERQGLLVTLVARPATILICPCSRMVAQEALAFRGTGRQSEARKMCKSLQ